MPGQLFGRGLTHMANAQAKHKAWQRGLLGFLQRVQKVHGGFVGHAVQIGQGRQPQSVQVWQCANNVGIDQLLDQFVAQTINLDGTTVREVQDGFFALGPAKQAACTAVVCLAFFANST